MFLKHETWELDGIIYSSKSWTDVGNPDLIHHSLIRGSGTEWSAFRFHMFELKNDLESHFDGVANDNFCGLCKPSDLKGDESVG